MQLHIMNPHLNKTCWKPGRRCCVAVSYSSQVSITDWSKTLHEDADSEDNLHHVVAARWMTDPCDTGWPVWCRRRPPWTSWRVWRRSWRPRWWSSRTLRTEEAAESSKVLTAQRGPKTLARNSSSLTVGELQHLVDDAGLVLSDPHVLQDLDHHLWHSHDPTWRHRKLSPKQQTHSDKHSKLFSTPFRLLSRTSDHIHTNKKHTNRVMWYGSRCK